MPIKIKRGDLEIEVDNVDDAIKLIDHLARIRGTEATATKGLEGGERTAVAKEDKEGGVPAPSILSAYKQKVASLKEEGYEFVTSMIGYHPKTLDACIVYPSGYLARISREDVAKYAKLWYEAKDKSEVEELIKREHHRVTASRIICVLRAFERTGILEEIVKRMEGDGGIKFMRFPKTRGEMLKMLREAHEDLMGR